MENGKRKTLYFWSQKVNKLSKNDKAMTVIGC